MKLRLPHKLQAALIATLASAAFTTLSSGTLAVATGAALLAGQQAYAAESGTQTFTGGEKQYTAGTEIFDGMYLTSTMTTGTTTGSAGAANNGILKDGSVNIYGGGFYAEDYTVSIWVTRESLNSNQLLFAYGAGNPNASISANGIYWDANAQTLRIGRGNVNSGYNGMTWYGGDYFTTSSMADSIGAGEMVNITFAVAVKQGGGNQSQTPTVWVNGEQVWTTTSAYNGNMNNTTNPIKLYVGSGVTYGNVSVTNEQLTTQDQILTLMGVAKELPPPPPSRIGSTFTWDAGNADAAHGKYVETTYSELGFVSYGTIYQGWSQSGMQQFFYNQNNQRHTLRFSSDKGASNKSIEYTFNLFTVGGFIVDEGAEGFDIHTKNNSDRSFYLGTTQSGTTAYSTIKEDFTLKVTSTHANAIIHLQGNQEFDVASGKTFHITQSNGNTLDFATQLTVKGGGTVAFDGTSVVAMTDTSSLEIQGGSIVSFNKNVTGLSHTIHNAGTLSFSGTVGVSNTLSGFEFDAVLTDYETGTPGKGFAGAKDYYIFKNTGSGTCTLAEVTYNGGTKTLTDGKMHIDGATDYTTYYIEADDATMDLVRAAAYAQTEGGVALGTVEVGGANATITVGSDQNLANLNIASGKSVTTAGAGTLTLANLSLGTGSTLGLAPNAHVTVTAKPTLSGRNITLATGSVLDLSGLTLDASLFGDIAGSVTGAGTVKLGTAEEMAFSGDQTTNLGTNVEIAGGIKFNGHGYNSDGHTLNLGNGTGTVAGVKVNGDLRLESKMYVNVKAGSSLTATGNLIMGHNEARNPGFLDVNGGTLSVGHIQIWDNTTDNSITLTNSTVVATQAGDLFTYNGSGNTGNATTVSATDVTLKSTGVDWAWNRGTAFGGTLTVDAGSNTITLGAAGADFSVVNPITLTSGTVGFAGTWDLSALDDGTATPTYTGGKEEGTNGFAKLVTTVQLADLTQGGSITADSASATFTVKGANGQLDTAAGTVTTSGDPNYDTFHVLTGSENVTQGRADGAHDPVYSLANGTELVVDDDLTGAKLTRENDSTGNATLNIKSGSTYTSDGNVKHVTITGAGTYALTKTTASGSWNLVPMVDVLDSTGWTGTVLIENVQKFGPMSLNDYGTSLSRVKLSSVTGWMPNNATFNPLVEIGNGGITLVDGGSDKYVDFAGGVAGTGNLNFAVTSSADRITFKFTGGVADWTGAFNLTVNKTANLVFSGSSTVVNAAIDRTNGTLNVEVGDGTAFTTTFNEAVNASKLEIKDGASATFEKAVTLNGNLSLRGTETAGASILLKEGATLNSNLDLSNGKTSHGTVTVAADKVLDLKGTNSNFWMSSNSSIVLEQGAQAKLGSALTVTGLSGAASTISNTNSGDDVYGLGKAGFTLTNVEASVNSDQADVQLRFDNSKFVTAHTVTLKNLQSVFSGMDIQGGTTTVGAADSPATTVQLGAVALSNSGNLTLAEHVTGTVNGMNVTASGTVTGGKLVMQKVITMGADATLALTGTTVDVSALSSGEAHPEYVDGQHDGSGFSSLTDMVKLVNFSTGGTVNADGATFIMGSNTGELIQEGDYRGYVSFDNASYNAYYVNVAGQTESLDYAINTAREKGDVTLEAVYLNAGTLNADVDTKVASLHINETADKATYNVSITGAEANFGTVSGKGTLNVDSATALTADTLSIAAGETLTLTGSENISFGAITSHGTLGIDADTLVTATGAITVNAGESLTTTGAGKLTGTSLTVYGDASLGADAEFSGDLNPNSGSLTIGGHTIVRGTMHGGDSVEGKEYKSAAILVESTGVLDVNNISANWGFSSFTVNGALNVTNELKLTTGNATYTVDGSGTITTKKLTLNNEGKYVFDGTNGLTLVVGEGGISAGNGGRTLTLANGLTVKASDDWTMNQNAMLNGTVNLNTQDNDLTISSVLSNAANTTGGLAITGGGTVALNGGNSFSGGLTVTGATVEMGHNSALGNANNAITIGQDGVIDLKGHDNVAYAYTLAGGTLQNTGNATGAGMKQTKGLTLTANSTIGGTGDFHIIAGDYAATTINLGNKTLTKTGANTVHFVNSTITEGTLQVDAGALDFRTDHGMSTVKANIVLNGGGTALTGGFKYADSETAVSRALAANQDVTASAAIELGTNVTLATNVATGKTLTMSGALTGNGGLTKTGDGTLALTAAASYNGATAVNAGNLALGSSLTTTGNVTVAAGAAITFANGATISANSLGLAAGSTLDFSAYQGAIGSKVNVVTTTTGVTGYDGASKIAPSAVPHGMTANVALEGNNIVLTFTPEAEGTMHLYILTGQSNSLGSVKGNPAPADLFAHYASGGLLYNGNMHKGGSRYIADPDWKIVDVQPRGEGDDSFAVTGPEYVFEYLMLKNGWFSSTPSKDSLGVIKASLDGGGDEYWVKDGTNSNYGVILDTVKKGYDEAKAMGYANVTIDGLLYLQGESNTHGGVAVQTNYNNFLTNLKADLEAAGIDTNKILFGEHSVLGEPATWGQTDTSVGNEKTASDTHTQLENLAKATEGIDFVYTRDLDKITSGDNMGVHYNGEAQITIGARYAYAFAVQNGKDVSYDLGNDKKGVVRGDNDQVALTDTAAWWGGTAPAAGQVAVWDVSSVSTPSPAVQLQGYGNYIADGATWTVGGIHVADAYKQLVTINGGTVSLGADGINLVGGGLSMTSDVSVRESQTWQAANGHKLVVNGTTTIGDNAKLTLADGLYLTFGYITGTGSLEIGTVTFDMDLDYMGTMAQASYISSKGEGANGYVNEVNLIDLSAGSGTISFTHGGGVDDITKRGGLEGCTLTLGEDSKTLKVTMPSTAPKTVYFTRRGEVTYTSTDDGENGIYNATELVLSGQQGAPATLTLSTALKSGVGIKAEGLGGTVKIGSDVVLNASSLETDGAPVTIAGSGEYVGKTLGAVGSVTAADVLGQGVTLASDWTGSVVLSGGNASFTGYTGMGNLADFYKAGSTIVFNGMYGYFSDSYTIGADIEFRGTGVDGTGAALTYTAGNQKTDEFSGTITGKGDFVFDKNAGTGETIKFTGNIAGWEGSITTGNHGSGPLNLTFGGSVTDVNAAITKGQNHPINVTVDATSAVSFNKALTGLSNLTLNANKSASVLGGIGTNATTLNGGASLTIGGTDTTNTLGTVTVNGTGSSLTINQAATITGVTLSNNASTTVSNNVAGANLGNVTLNNNTALTIGGTAAVAAGNVKLADTSAASIVLGNDFSVSQLDTIGGEKTLSIGSAEGVTKTLTTGALGFDNFNTVIALQNVNMVVTGAATVGELDAHSNNIGTMLVGSGATLNLQGTTQWNTSDNKYVDLVISDGGAVSVTGGTENTLRGVNLGAGSSLTFGTGTSTTIGGAVVLANTITNDGSVTLTGTVNLDALTALTEKEGYDEGEHDGNGFYYNSSTVRVFTENRVGVVDSSAATITYKGVGGTFDAQAGTFTGNGEKDMTTFHVRMGETSEDYTTAYTYAGEQLTTVKLADKTAINLNKANAALAHLVLTEDASATVQVSENASIASVEGVGAGQTLTVTGTTGKVLTLTANNTMEGTVDVQGGTLKTTAETALGNAHVDVTADGTLELGANLTLANGMDNAGTVNLTNKALTLNGREGGTAYTMGTLSNGASSDVTLNNHVTATFDKDASVRRLTGNAGSAVVVGENATLTLTSTNRNSYYSLVGDLDVQGTLKLKGSNGDIRLAGYEDDQVFNLGHLDIDGASGITYMLTSGSVNYTTDIVVKSLSGGGTGHTLQVTTCYTGGNAGTGKVVNFILGDETSAASAPAYTGTIQYGTGSSYVKTGGGMNLVIKDEYVAANAVLQSTMSGGTYATVTVDTARAQVKGLKDATTGKTVNVRGTEADKNRVLEITGDDNYTYNGKLGANLDVVHSGSGTQSFGGVDGFDGSIDVEAGTLNIMNIAQAASVSAQDVTINNSNLGVYTNATAAEENVGALTVKGTLTASGENAKLNANLVMDAGSTLDVSAYDGMGGLNMGCTVTLNPGMYLSAKDMEGVAGLGFMDAYDLHYGVEEFYIGNTQYGEITFASETWVKANEVFNNDLFKTGDKDYYVFYSGVNPGGNGGNVGTIYIVQVPEPTTGTLSLLALCALAARRRRK